MSLINTGIGLKTFTQVFVCNIQLLANGEPEANSSDTMPNYWVFEVTGAPRDTTNDFLCNNKMAESEATNTYMFTHIYQQIHIHV